MVVKYPNDYPLDDTVILWRYISFSKFVSLLVSKQLHFTRADKFLDTWESSVPQKDLETSRNYFASLLEQPVVNVGGVSIFEKSVIRNYIHHFFRIPEQEADAITDSDLPKYMLKIANRFQFVNCWHMNEGESAGMWQLYMNENEGVAIQTTVEAFNKCLERSEHPVYVGAVTYIDYNKESWGEYHPLSPIFHKRNSFAHERELRAVIVNPSGIDAKNTEGVLIETDLNELITQVFIHPRAKRWFRETVQSVCRQYGLTAQPVQSHLYDEPLF